MKPIFWSILLLALLTSCMRLAGLRSHSSPERISKFAIKNEIPEDSYGLLMDSAIVINQAVNKIYRSLNGYIPPPLGILAYGQDNILQAEISMQDVDGSFRTEWNRFGTFDSFPLKNAVNELDSIPYESELKQLHFMTSKLIPFNKAKAPSSIEESNSYKLLIFWQYETYAHTKLLIQQVDEYMTQFGDKDIQVYYINMDESYCRSESKIELN